VLDLHRAGKPFTRVNLEDTYITRRRASWVEEEARIAEKARAGFSLYTPRGEGDKLRRVLDQQELTAEILSL